MVSHRPGSQRDVPARSSPGPRVAGLFGIWSSRLVQAAIAEATRSQSVSAPTITAPPARQSLAEPAETAKRKKKKAKKRRAADPLPELPPAGKKLKKKKGKKQFQFGSTTQGDGPPPPPNEAQLFAMMKLMAAKHDWSVEDQARQFRARCFSLLSPHRPPTGAPYPGLHGPGYGSHQSGTSGAGRPTRGRVFHPADGAASSPRPGARLCGPSVVGFVRFRLVLSPRIVHHGRGRVVGYLHAPALSESEAPPALRHLREEAEALLLRYLGEFYSVPADPAAGQPKGSRLFRADAAPSPGIPLTADFKAEYDRIANEPTPTSRTSGLRRSFLFQPKVYIHNYTSTKFFNSF